MDLSRPLSIVTPTLDGEVLAVLAMQDDATFTTGQLRRMLGAYSEEGIRKVLQRLTRQGVVRSNRVGNSFAYRFNRDHLAAKHIRALAGLQAEFLGRLESLLGSWDVPPVYAAVFGSAAHGTMTFDSDLDVLLVRPADADELQWRTQVDALADQVTRWTGNDTRPFEITDTDIAAHAAEPVLREVSESGLTVAGTRAWLTEQLRQGNRKRANPAL
jgi:hypothetical protein